MVEAARSGIGTRIADLTEALKELGFAQYEARCYVGLMAAEPQTGYRVSKVTGVPQPKVYETLRKLVSRGVVQEIAGDPTLFTALPPDVLLDQLEDTFDRRLHDARESVKAMAGAQLPSDVEYVERFERVEDVIRVSAECLATATRRVYISASAPELNALQKPIEAATARDVDVVVLAFGRDTVALDKARVFHHASTDGALYRRHQARHVALVADSRQTVNAVAADGESWQAIRTSSEPVIAAVKGFIRHDIDMQQVFEDFGPQLIEAYGPGLQALETYRQDQQAAPSADAADDDSGEARRIG